MQLSARKNGWYRNRTILNIGEKCLHAKAIAFGKSSLRLKKLKLPKRYQKRIYKHIILILCKKTAGKKHLGNIRELRPF